MKPLGLYQPGDSWVHRLDPPGKILYIFATVVISFVIVIPSLTAFSLVLSVIILLTARVLPKVLPLTLYSFFVLISVAIIQGLYMAENTTPVLAVGPLVFYQEGICYAFRLGLQVMNILGAFAVLVLTTKPSDLIESLVKRGLSPQIGYVLSSVLQIVPQMMATAEKITDAQRSRGMETEGNLGVRLKAFLPLIGPVVMNSLLDTKERAMALEARGFNHRGLNSFLTEQKPALVDIIIHWALVLIIGGAIVWRIYQWLQ